MARNMQAGEITSKLLISAELETKDIRLFWFTLTNKEDNKQRCKKGVIFLYPKESRWGKKKKKKNKNNKNKEERRRGSVSQSPWERSGDGRVSMEEILRAAAAAAMANNNPC